MRIRITGLTILTLLLAASRGVGQVAWDAPYLVAPIPQPGFGIYLTEPDPGDLGVLMSWRPVGAWRGIGLRFGIADGPGPGDVSGLAGADFYGSMNRSSQDFPLDVSWVAGVGLGFGDFVLVSLPLGVSLGHTFSGEGVEFVPYLSPRLILDGYFGRDFPDDDLDLALAVDLSVDVAFSPALTIRFGATFGDREALAIGLAF
ncbi:MAG: hypothetical protein HY701_12270 [Gemmatimonadetes bacterium]|nr:hypothetical protein [Gemmatimonadota bacterium]